MNSRTQQFFLQVLSTSLGLLIGAWWMDGVDFKERWWAIITALVLALLNAFVKPILVLLTIPATIFTLGLFLLVINAAMILIAREIVPGFYVDGFWSAFWLSLLISIINSLFGGRMQVQRGAPGQDIER